MQPATQIWMGISDDDRHVLALCADELICLSGKRKKLAGIEERLFSGSATEKDLKGATRVPIGDVREIENVPGEEFVVLRFEDDNGKKSDHLFIDDDNGSEVAIKVAQAVWGQVRSDEVQLRVSEIMLAPLGLGIIATLILGIMFGVSLLMDPDKPMEDRAGKAGAIKRLIEMLGTQGIVIAWVVVILLCVGYVALRAMSRPTKTVYRKLA